MNRPVKLLELSADHIKEAGDRQARATVAKHRAWWLVLVVNLTQSRITWEGSLIEGSSGSGWLVDIYVRDCLGYIN